MHARSAFLILALAAQTPSGSQSWPAYAGDNAATHYSPLAGIDASNVSRLSVASGLMGDLTGI